MSDSMPPTPDEMVGTEPLASPGSPSSESSSQASTPLDAPPLAEIPAEVPKRVPSLRSVSDPPSMHPSSTPLGTLISARKPAAASVLGGVASDAMLKARNLAAQRMGKVGSPPSRSPIDSSGRISPAPGGLAGGLANMRLPPGVGGIRPGPPISTHSAPAGPKQGLSARRGMKLNMGGGPTSSPTPKLSDMNGAAGGAPNGVHGSKLNDFKKYIDTEKGWITFEGAATITEKGVNFSNGKSFEISLDEVEPLGELGKGNYGTVYKVRHAKPSRPRFGQGMSGFRQSSFATQMASASDSGSESAGGSPMSPNSGQSCTGVIMAMKEIRLELDESKFTTILKELVILHECVSPYIIDFYGAFFQEGAVYMCIEYMDGGSIDKLYDGGVGEDVLRRITYSTIMGLKTLKDDHNIIHRDVKPTNILVNTRGQIKICDFGVSGNLVASIAKTNIGCQSYMAPERIKPDGMNAPGTDGSYSVQSDIWSLGLTIIECAMGRYPYPPEVASSVFSQLSAIVEGDPPDLPSEGFSVLARDFVTGCLNKKPSQRPTYAALLNHAWIQPLSKPPTIAEEIEEGDEAEAAAEAVGKLHLGGCPDDPVVATWVRTALSRKSDAPNTKASKPALHKVALNSPQIHSSG